jgi:hypothetical protein
MSWIERIFFYAYLNLIKAISAYLIRNASTQRNLDTTYCVHARVSKTQNPNSICMLSTIKRVSVRSKQFFLYSILLVTALFAGCSSDDDNNENVDNTFWNEAKLNDFPLSEVTYLDIDISHPEVANGAETKPGKIEITIPYSQTSLMLSLKQFNLDNSKYQISPLPGEQQDFSGDPVTYTISSVTSETKSVHYDVSVVYGGEPFFTNAKITGFKFEKSKNPALAATIDAVKIAEYENYSENAIYIIVPEGTDFTQLTPTITYDAAKIYYSTANDFILYPANGLKVDFKYPKHFYLQAENSLGTKSLVYNVIVDVANPIRFDSPLVTDNVAAGDGSAFKDFFAVATWTNQGNHPVTGMAPGEYKDKTYPVPNYPGDANVITASLINPTGGTVGVLPGEKGEVNVRVRRSPVTGLYTTTAVFKPTFSFDTRRISYWPPDDRIEAIFAPQTLTIKSTIEE